jgi:hypothetical protein
VSRIFLEFLAIGSVAGLFFSVVAPSSPLEIFVTELRGTTRTVYPTSTATDSSFRREFFR